MGLTEGEAAREGLDPMAATVTVQERPPFYPGAGWVTVKLVAEAGEGRLIGVQAAGRGGVDGLLNVASLAVLRGATVRDLLHFEHAYAPSLSDLHHPLHAAAEAVLRRMAHARRQGAEPAA